MEFGLLTDNIIRGIQGEESGFSSLPLELGVEKKLMKKK